MSFNIYGDYQDEEETKLKTVRVDSKWGHSLYEFRFTYEENGDVVVRFADLEAGHPPTTGYMKFNSEDKIWEPWGNWKQYLDGEIEVELTFRGNGEIDLEEWYQDEKPHSEGPTIPNMKDYIHYQDGKFNILEYEE